MRAKRGAGEDRVCGVAGCGGGSGGSGGAAAGGGGGGVVCALEGCPPGMAASPGGTMEFIVLPTSALVPLESPAAQLAEAMTRVHSPDFAAQYGAVEALRRACRFHPEHIVAHACVARAHVGVRVCN